MRDALCQHPDAPAVGGICRHVSDKVVAEAQNQPFFVQFTGSGVAYNLVCEDCARQPDIADSGLRELCASCFAGLQTDKSDWLGIVGKAEILRRPTVLRFEHADVTLRGLGDDTLEDLQPYPTAPGIIQWIGLTGAGRVFSADVLTGQCEVLPELPPDSVSLQARLALQVSGDGTLAAVFNPYGDKGIVLSLPTGRATMVLRRNGSHSDITYFPVAFARLDDRNILIHATSWSRLDISDPLTGESLTDRDMADLPTNRGIDPYYLPNYFRGRLCISPGQDRIATSSWRWHPSGLVDVWSLRRWLNEDIWESDVGPTKKWLCEQIYGWDDPICWIDDTTLAVWGFGEDEEAMIPAVRLFDVVSGALIRWFAGPEVAETPVSGFRANRPRLLLEPSPFVFDEYLFAQSKLHGTSVWDVATGERLLQDDDLRPDRYHPGAKTFLTALPGWRFRISRLAQGAGARP